MTLSKTFKTGACVWPVALLTLAACLSSEYTDAPYSRVQVQTPAEIDFVKSALAEIQNLSIEKDREYCGFIGLNEQGDFNLSRPRKGRKDSCVPKEPHESFTILASYHTHGAWSEDFDSEVPSVDDLASDIDEGNDGYILTPGGRLWYNDAKAEVSTLLCGPDCVTSDPDFEEDLKFPVAQTYTLVALEKREQQLNR